MTTLVLFTLLALLPTSAVAQEPEAADGATITSSQIAGLSDLDELSPGLRGDISALVGETVNRERLAALTTRIQAERPDFVAAVRAVAERDGEARVVFLVARVRGDSTDDENVNARYTVESVEIIGVAESFVSPMLRDDFQKLVGQRLNHDAIQPLIDRLHAELPGYDVTRRTARGSTRGQIRVTIALSTSDDDRWLRFARSSSKLLYHGDQGWSAALDIPMGGQDTRVSLRLAAHDRDDLIEENAGVGLRIESRRIGTEQLGASLELSRYHADYRTNTLAVLAANPRIPAAYHLRTTVAPSLTFAFNAHLRLTGGVSVSDLESRADSSFAQTASVLVAGLDYTQLWRQSGASHAIAAAASVRSATEALSSDLFYTRYTTDVSYRYRRGPGMLIVAASAGTITGDAPLFERFALGDASRLRGWDKFDVAPAGGDGMWYSSAEYRHHVLAFFLDAGSVWDRDADHQTRLSTGVGAHGENAFFTLGVPLNRDTLRPTLIFGVRF